MMEKIIKKRRVKLKESSAAVKVVLHPDKIIQCMGNLLGVKVKKDQNIASG
jgi:hypothetical protein